MTDRLASTDVDLLSDDHLLEMVVDAERVLSWAAAVQAEAVAALAGRQLGPLPADHPTGISEPVGGGNISEWCVDELATALRATTTRAGQLLRFALGLADLSATYAMLRDGLIDKSRASVVTLGVEGLSPHVAHAVERAVLPGAVESTAGQLRAAVGRAVADADPEGIRRRNRVERAGRRVAIYPDPTSGTAAVTAQGLDATDARAVWESLDAIAHAADGTGDPRTLDARRADALVALLTGHDPLPDWTTPPTSNPDWSATYEPRIGGLPTGVLPTRCGTHRADPRRSVALQVVATPAALVGEDGAQPAWLAGHGWLTPTHARALLAHAAIHPTLATVDQDTGALLAVHTVGRPGPARDPSPTGTGTSAYVDPPRSPGYRPPADLAQLVHARDLICRFPGCRHPARRCDLDHFDPWPVGPTSRTNLWTLCRRHHRLKHSGAWTVRAVTSAGTDGPVTWQSPAGRTLTSTPPDYVRRQ